MALLANALVLRLRYSVNVNIRISGDPIVVFQRKEETTRFGLRVRVMKAIDPTGLITGSSKTGHGACSITVIQYTKRGQVKVFSQLGY
jgi:hypothetical protein